MNGNIPGVGTAGVPNAFAAQQGVRASDSEALADFALLCDTVAEFRPSLANALRRVAATRAGPGVARFVARIPGLVLCVALAHSIREAYAWIREAYEAHRARQARTVNGTASPRADSPSASSPPGTVVPVHHFEPAPPDEGRTQHPTPQSNEVNHG